MPQLIENEQTLLLTIAREAVRSFLSLESLRLPEIPGGVLHERHGAFVSIHNGRGLRGCIGNVQPSQPLYQTVVDCAISASVADPRFLPLALAELPAVVFEISVLSTLQKIDRIESIEVGKHGLMISKHGARGLLLPQVATQYRWDRVRFLEETCQKAGLEPDAWKSEATIYTFSAFVFSEKQLVKPSSPRMA